MLIVVVVVRGEEQVVGVEVVGAGGRVHGGLFVPGEEEVVLSRTPVGGKLACGSVGRADGRTLYTR